MEFETNNKAIAQIHYAESKAIAGTGFRVSGRYVLTCAHVVKSVLKNDQEPIGDVISVTLPFINDQPQEATVVFYQFNESDYGADAAVLRLVANGLPVIELASLVPLRQYFESKIRVLGFPGGDRAGGHLTAVTRGQIPGGWVQIEDTKETGLAVEEGFSGAPVWCEAHKAFVGMVVARYQARPTAKLGYMIPTEKLQAPLQAVRQHSLNDLLAAKQQLLISQIMTAYKVCRPDSWSKPFQTELQAILADLGQMPAGQLSEPRLVQFAACLLNQPGIVSVRNKLIVWVEQYTADLPKLRSQLQDRQNQQQSSLSKPINPCLFVSIQADKTTQAAPYRVNGWLICKIHQYNPETGEGAEPLSLDSLDRYVDDPSSIDPEVGVKYKDIPLLLATYLDQVGNRGIDLQHLTVEFFMPLALMNKAVEHSPIPAEYGFPFPLGIGENCPHVVLRSQERLEFGRSLGLWQSKWQRLQDSCKDKSAAVFIKGGDNLKQLQKDLKTALGLRLTRLPKTTNQGELGLLLATGTPAAVWVRCQAVDDIDWNALLEQQVLNCCLKILPETVTSLRRAASELDDETDLGNSTDLGHHLSFLWEDPQRVPPKIVYSAAAL
ncbi:MAG: trypsin-like peptidase domain-containing protein [Cyanobacteria bacterium J06635_1]